MLSCREMAGSCSTPYPDKQNASKDDYRAQNPPQALLFFEQEDAQERSEYGPNFPQRADMGERRLLQCEEEQQIRARIQHTSQQDGELVALPLLQQLARFQNRRSQTGDKTDIGDLKQRQRETCAGDSAYRRIHSRLCRVPRRAP